MNTADTPPHSYSLYTLNTLNTANPPPHSYSLYTLNTMNTWKTLPHSYFSVHVNMANTANTPPHSYSLYTLNTLNTANPPPLKTLHSSLNVSILQQNPLPPIKNKRNTSASTRINSSQPHITRFPGIRR